MSDSNAGSIKSRWHSDKEGYVLNHQMICASGELEEGDTLFFRVRYRGETVGALLIRVGGAPHAWLDRCVHMARPLDGEDDEVFDPHEGVIRCSNHGITYKAVTGACQAGLCAGKSLTALCVAEHDGAVRLVDRHAVLAP
jgi:nitrite reductase/ring-hydroxylating ferredoxin subunit